MMNKTSDEALVKESVLGSRQAFKELVLRHEGKVAGVVESMLGDIPEAVDVGQEVFIRFYKALHQFKGDSSVSTYLIRIAINLSLNEIKRLKKRKFLFIPVEEGRKVAAGDDGNDIKEVVLYELSKLDPEFQSVITLRLMEGYSTVETAEMLGIPLGTVLSRLSRAQKKLKNTLTQHLT